MPIERTNCDECGTRENKCPACGSNFVTPRESLRRPTPNEVVDYGTDSDSLTYEHVCWDCGWSEEVTIHVERDRS